jgi:hypothetical protein
MAEYQMAEGDVAADVARDLIAQAGDPDRVHFYPRPNVPGGGVFEVDDDVAEKVVQQRAKVRDEERQRIENAQAAAEERDARADETGMTPAELGFRANAGTDPGSKAQAEQAAETTGDKPAEDAEEDDATDDEAKTTEETDEVTEDDKPKTPAQRRAARRASATKSDAPEDVK